MEYCNDFSHDLKFGQIGENLIGEIFSNKKIEVKRDKWICKSGNIAVEYESRGRKSGIAKSTADWWCFILSGGMEDKMILLIETNKLKAKPYVIRAKKKNDSEWETVDNFNNRRVYDDKVFRFRFIAQDKNAVFLLKN